MVQVDVVTSRACLAMFIGLLVACGSSRPTVQGSPFERGKEALQQGRLADAVTALEAAQRKTPENIAVLRSLAQAYRRQGQFKAAVGVYDTILQSGDSQPADWLQAGHLRFGLSQYRQAMASYEKADSLEALDESGRIRRAMCATYIDEPERAMKWLLADKDRLKDNADYHLAVARTYVALSQPDSAVSAYRLASKLAASSPVPDSEAGAVFEAIGFQDRAIRAYQRALKRSPEHVPTLIRYGGVLVNTGNVLDAIPLLERAKRLAPDSVVVLSRLGAAFSAAGMLNEATATLQSAVALEPNQPALHSGLAEAAYRAGDLSLSAKHLRKALALDPERTLDANAFRQVRLMQVLIASRCESGVDSAKERKQLEAVWQKEGFSDETLQRSLSQVIGNADALKIIDSSIQACKRTRRK